MSALAVPLKTFEVPSIGIPVDRHETLAKDPLVDWAVVAIVGIITIGVVAVVCAVTDTQFSWDFSIHDVHFQGCLGSGCTTAQ